MSAAIDGVDRTGGRKAAPALRTLVLCDLADSTALVERLGDQRAHILLRRHDRLARDLVETHGGREIDKTDGFLILFERPSQAVAFALDYQRALATLSSEVGEALRARVGIHLGEVLVYENDAADVARGAKLVEVEGLVKPVAARLASLARPGQILLSATAFAVAQRAQSELLAAYPKLRVASHGRYRCKGVPDALGVHEIGEVGTAPLVRPPSSEKAWLERPFLLRPVALLAEALAVIAVVVGLAWLSLRTEPAIAFAERDWVVVGDLRNLTGDTVYDASLDAAFRIGLEQSRFVNVVPDLQVRQALARMQKDTKSGIDRTVGSEVAQRERARALVLATLAPHGKDLRLTAEIVDPATTRTVATESVDVDDADAVIPATDALVQRLRTSLGESVAQIEATSLPLEKVTTRSIEALRAYSLSLRAVREGDFERARGLLDEALAHDPEFGLAYARIGANYLTSGRPREAAPMIEKALALKDRLSKRELTYLEALDAMQSKGAGAFAAWKVYADLYPDDAAGHNNAGLVAYFVLNDCKQAIPYFTQASTLNHPLRSFSNYCLGYCELHEGRFEQALQRFQQARDAGLPARWMGLATAYLALGRYDEATAFLAEGGRGPSEAHAGEGWTHRNALLVDQGDFDAALATVRDGLADQGAATDVQSRWRLRAAELPVLALLGREEALRTKVLAALAELEAISPEQSASMPYDHTLHLARWGAWAARAGAVDAARRALARLRETGRLDDFPHRLQAAAVLEAEIALAESRPQDALDVLAAAGTDSPAFALLTTAARARAAAGDTRGAALAYRKIADSRGLAVAEWHDSLLGQAERLIDWNLARYERAKLVARTDADEARKDAEAFLAQWKAAPDTLESVREAKALAAASAETVAVRTQIAPR